MIKTKVIFESEARKKSVSGVSVVANVAAETMGQQGNYTIIQQPYGSPKVTKDGYYSIRRVILEDAQENQGAQLLIEGAKKTAEEAGDGTTTYCVITRELVQKGVNMIESGSSRTDIKRGIEAAVAKVTKAIDKMAVKVDRKSNMIEQVATISANNNSEIGKNIAGAIKKVKENGVVTVSESKSMDSYIDVVEGMKIDRGFLSPYFITNSEKMECVLTNPYILLYDEQISGIAPLINILEEATKAGRGVLIIAKDVNNEALATIIQNKVKANLPLACIHAPGYGGSMRDELEDVALITGGTVVSETVGTDLESCTLEMLGEADKVVINRHSTTFIGGRGDKELINARVKAVKLMLEEMSDPHAKEMVENRLANIDGGIAVYYVGGATESEVAEKKDLIEDAIAATRSALEMGVVPGGGSSLVHASKVLNKMKGKTKGEQSGIDIVREALYAPLKQIMKNAGLPSEVILDGVLNWEEGSGYDLNKREYCDMIERGILDTAKVEISALNNASSVASMILMGNCIITEIEERK